MNWDKLINEYWFAKLVIAFIVFVVVFVRWWLKEVR